jgi:hypothetical protein
MGVDVSVLTATMHGDIDYEDITKPPECTNTLLVIAEVSLQYSIALPV